MSKENINKSSSILNEIVARSLAIGLGLSVLTGKPLDINHRCYLTDTSPTLKQIKTEFNSIPIPKNRRHEPHR